MINENKIISPRFLARPDSRTNDGGGASGVIIFSLGYNSAIAEGTHVHDSKKPTTLKSAKEGTKIFRNNFIDQKS